MVDFEAKKEEARKAVQLLIKYSSSIGWEDFGDKGNNCWKPYNSTPSEIEEIELWHGAIRSTLVKGSLTFVLLESLVAKQLGCKYVTYDWLCKAISRILAGGNLTDLEKMLKLSRAVQQGIKEKGLTKINSIQEALA